MIVFQLAFRYLRSRPLRTGLTTLAVVFGVMIAFSADSVLQTMDAAFKFPVQPVSRSVDATVVFRAGQSFSAEVAGSIASLPQVGEAHGSLLRRINLPPDYFDQDPDTPDAFHSMQLTGIDPAAEAWRSIPVRAGRFLEAGDTASAVITEALAATGGYAVGGYLPVLTPGGVAAVRVAGIVDSRLPMTDETVLVTLPQAQTLLGEAGKINMVEVRFRTASAEVRNEQIRALQAALGGDFRIGSLEVGSEIMGSFKAGRAAFQIVGGLSILMGGFIIFNSFRTLVTERRRDLAMLRALGAGRGMIFALLLAESALQGLAGTGIGILTGYALAGGLLMGIQPLMDQFLAIKLGWPAVTVSGLANAALMGVGVTVAASMVPVLQVIRVSPVDALRPVSVEVSRRRAGGWIFWVGIALIGLSAAALLSRNLTVLGSGCLVFFIGITLAAPDIIRPCSDFFGGWLARIAVRDATIDIARLNLARQPVRAAVTASTMMIGLAMLITCINLAASSMSGFLRLLEKNLASDFLLVPPSVALWGGNFGASPELAGSLRALDSVEAVNTYRFADSQTAGVAVGVIGIDPVEFPRVSGLYFSQGIESDAYDALAGGRALIANPIFILMAGVNSGDDIRLSTPHGYRTYRVAAIAGDYLNAKTSTVHISTENLEEDFGGAGDIFFQINLRPDADRASAETAIRRLIQPYPQFRLETGAAYFSLHRELLENAIRGMLAALFSLMIPALIAVFNTLAISVLERTREIGLLKAVGTTRRQLNRMILAESMVLALIGILFGVASGLYLGYLAVLGFRSIGLPLDWVFPVSGVGLGIAASLAIGALAAWLPMRYAQRVNPLAALRYE